MAMIRMTSQCAIDRTWRVVAPTSRRSASSRRRRSTIMISVLSTAIDVKAKIIATKNGPSQWFISLSASVAVTSEALSLTWSPGYC
jgi:hypothetical protein